MSEIWLMGLEGGEKIEVSRKVLEYWLGMLRKMRRQMPRITTFADGRREEVIKQVEEILGAPSD